ncbi:MAG TPA: RMD1 family protein [Spirochaetota bacterium]|nr:RMD1 family protein [Spirochaetota bacterium]
MTRKKTASTERTTAVRISAYHLGDSINLKLFKSEFTGTLISSSSFELFYSTENGGYLYIFNYGVVAFADVTDVDKSRILSHLRNYTQNPLSENYSDDFNISLSDDTKPVFDFDNLCVQVINESLIKNVMFNVAQSVALDFYDHESEKFLEQVNKFTSELEHKGKISLSKRKMLQFIGQTLSRKNRVIDNLYIFDVPDIVWDDKILDEINTGMVKLFDLRTRFKEVQSNFKNIEDNLAIFMELYQHRMSNLLEWIIIILILIEVADLFLTKWLHLLK